MPKVAPSQRVREEITRVLKDGLDGEADVTSTLLRLGAQRLAQELLEEEVTDFLGRERYVRHRGGQPHRGLRAGARAHGRRADPAAIAPGAGRPRAIPVEVAELSARPHRRAAAAGRGDVRAGPEHAGH